MITGQGLETEERGCFDPWREQCAGEVDPLPVWKRTLDLACLLLLAPAWVPMMAIIALMIRISSPGSVLFCQERIGCKGKPFKIFKFRTMRQVAEEPSHVNYLQHLIRSNVPMQKLDGEDLRVLPVGVLLRASGLDELPQLFNILRGEMSFVGPRPCIRCEYDAYRPEDRNRLHAVPGLTGLWQVSGKNKTTFQQMVDLDVRYSQTLSLWQDLSILFRTFPVLIEQVTEARRRKKAPVQPAVRKLQPPRLAREESRPATSV
jgi:exopolysaccharide production protein ExoY